MAWMDTEAARAASPFATARAARWPRLRLDVLAIIFAGGCIGGLARYGATRAWPTPAGQFPWTIFAVNTAGAFVLAVVVVVAAELVASRYMRPLLGTGFCGAFTTFSSIVVTVDELFAHGHPGVASSYLIASIVAGLGAAWLGLLVARAAVAVRHRSGKDQE